MTSKPTSRILSVSLVITFPNDGPVLFNRWLPMEEEHFIKVQKENIKLKLWFDEKTTWWASQSSKEEIAKWINVSAHRIYADFTIKGIPSELADYIQDKEGLSKNRNEESLDNQYNDLCRNMYEMIIPILNRLVSYARAMKKQFWLEEFEYDPRNANQFFLRSEAKARVGRGKPFRFNPYNIGYLDVIASNGSDCIEENEWEDFKEFILSNRSAPLVKTLLASARELNSKGHRRSSIIEAVTALEISLSDFCREADKKELSTEIANRINVSNFKKIREKFGLRGMFDIFLPIMFSEEQLPATMLSSCRSAIELRNNVVHSGQQNIDQKDLRRMIINVEKCCDFLQKKI